MSKKLILLSLVILSLMLLSQNANAGVTEPTIYFCTSVDEGWNPVNENTSFSISPENGGVIYALVKLPYGVGCKKVKFDIYKGDSLENTILVNTKSSARQFMTKLTFHEEGEYNIEVSDSYKNLLVQGTVTIVYSYGYKNHMLSFKRP